MAWAGEVHNFSEDFSGYGSDGTDINGDASWETTDVSTGAGVSDRALTKSGFIDGRSVGVTNADLSLTFQDARQTTFAEFEAILFFGPAADIPDDVSVAFYVNATGTVVAYNSTTPTALDHTPIASNTAVKFSVAADYLNELFDLYLDDVKVADDFAFYSSSNSVFTQFVVRADSATNISHLDTVAFVGSDPNFTVTNATPEELPGNDVMIVLSDVSPGTTYRLIARDNNAASGYVDLGTTTFGAPPHMFVDSGVLADDGVRTRYYQIVDEDANPKVTNSTVWVMQRRDRISQRWYVLGAPVQFGDSDENDLSREAGQQFARGLDAAGNFGDAPKLYKRDAGGTIETFWLSSTFGWTEFGDSFSATSPVPSGAAVWINTPPGQTADRTVFTGFEHSTSAVVRIYQDSWTLFSWPFATRTAAQLGTDGESGWGFAASGGTGGTSRRNSDVIYHPQEQKYLWLDQAGDWQIWGGGAASAVSFEPGDAYFYYATVTNFNYRPLPRQ